MLVVDGVSSGYRSTEVLHRVSITAPAGRVTCLIGPNGAGKTTLARTISGALRCRSGTIEFDGTTITNARPERLVKMGLVQVFERRELFPLHSVRQNLILGSFTKYRQM